MRDDRGAAALEGIIVLAILAGVLFAALLLGMWGTRLQSAHMGARLLAFDAGDVELAKFGRPSNTAVQQRDTTNWTPLFGTLIPGARVDWLAGLFTLTDSSASGSVAGTQDGRLPGQTQSLFDYTPATLGYHAGDRSAALNSWGAPESVARLTFLRISFNVGRYRASPNNLASMTIESIPTQPAILETIFGRIGVH